MPIPGERGTYEKTKGLIREYLQKGTEIPGYIDYLWAVADSLNDWRRAKPGFRKLSEVCTEPMLAKLRSSSRPPAVRSDRQRP
jgi:IS30 family transposase